MCHANLYTRCYCIHGQKKEEKAFSNFMNKKKKVALIAIWGFIGLGWLLSSTRTSQAKMSALAPVVCGRRYEAPFGSPRFFYAFEFSFWYSIIFTAHGAVRNVSVTDRLLWWLSFLANGTKKIK